MTDHTNFGAAPRSRRTATVVPLAVAVGIATLIGWAAWPVLRPAPEVRTVQAVFDRTTVADTQIIDGPRTNTPTVQAAGWLEAEPFIIACTALADGVVESIEVLEGEYVERGQIVAQLVAEDSELRLRRAEAVLAQNLARVAEARVTLTAAEDAWEHPVALDRAAEMTAAQLAETEAELARLPMRIEAATATLRRLEEEAKSTAKSATLGATTDLEVIIAEQSAAAQRAEVAALEALRPVLEAQRDRRRAEARAAERDLRLRIEDRRRLDGARAALAAAEADAARATAARDEARLELDRMTIRAPISGYVQRRLKVPGDKVMLGMDSEHSAHLVHLYDPKNLRVRVDVPLADAAHVSVGQAAEVIVEVLPDRTFRGAVLRTTHEADLQKNTLEVQVSVIDPDPILRPEMLTRVKFLPPGGTGPNAEADAAQTRVLIPVEALDTTAAAPRVWLVTDRANNRGTLSPRSVTVVNEDAGWLTVIGNVPPGSLLAVNPPRRTPGTTVALAKPAAGGTS
ncbi:MAG: efflux RND transporter periplasmic adaptor subunit [Planctomycetota bacterium]